MKRWWGLIGLGVAVYLVVVVFTIPAALVVPSVTKMAQERGVHLVVSGVEGSVWSGQAVTASVDGRALGRTQWDLSMWRLLLGQVGLGFRVEPDGGYLTGDGLLGSEHWRLRNVEGRMPATALLNYLPQFPLPVVPDGTVSLRLEELTLRAGRTEALAGTLIWSQAALAGPTAVRFGDLKLDLSTTPEGNVAGELSDAGGPLAIKGTLTLAPDRTYKLSATLSTRDGADPMLVQSLSFIGQPDAQGGYRVTWAGRL